LSTWLRSLYSVAAPTVIVAKTEYNDLGQVDKTLALKDYTSPSTYTFVETTYTYDGYGRSDETTYPDPDGAGDNLPAIKVRQEYDSVGRHIRTSTLQADDDLISKTEDVYDSGHDGGMLLWQTRRYDVITSPGDNYVATEYEYGDQGRMEKVTTPDGTIITMDYSITGNVLARYIWSDNDTATASDDRVLEQTDTLYDIFGRTVMETRYQRTHTTSDPEAIKTDLSAGTHDAAESRRTYVCTFYSDLGNVATVANYGVETTAMSAPPTTVPTDSSASVLVSVIEYDGYDRTEKTTDTAGKVTRTFYNTVGRKEYVVENYDGSSTHWGTTNGGPGDALNNRSNITDKDVNRITQYTFNTAGLLINLKAVDPAYNGNGTTTDDQETVYAYSTGAGIKCTVPRKDLLISTTYPEDDDVAYTYHSNGALETLTDQNGTVHEYEYDDLRRLEFDKVTTFSESVDVDDTVKAIKRVYDDNGRLASVTSYAETACTNALNGIAFTYANGLGLLTKSEQDHDDLASGSSIAVQYEYDMADISDVITRAGRLKYVTYPESGELTEREVYYNLPSSGLGKGINRLDAIANAEDSPSTTYAQFTYMGAGAIVQEAHTEVTDGLTLDYDTDPASNQYEYKGLDDFGRLVEQKWRSDEETPTIKDHFSYGYDTASNRLWRKNEVTRAVTPDPLQFDEVYHDNDYADAYDGLHRLRHFRRGLISLDGGENDIDAGDDTDRREQWVLDGVGNWTEVDVDATGFGSWGWAEGRTHNTDNEITEVNEGSWVDPTYDVNGNMTSGAKPGTTITGRQHYRYDAWNRLTVVYIEVANAGWDKDDDTLVEQYEYDGLHRRIAKIVPNAGTSTNRDRTDYYYNTSWQVLEEKRADNVSTAVAANETLLARYQYIWSPRYIDSPVLRDADTDDDGDCTDGSGDSERLYYTTDANHNVTALVGTDGEVIERYVYDPYGQPTIYDDDWSETIDYADSRQNEITYCGYRYSDGSRLYQARHRWYDYAHGRWLSRDPKDSNSPAGGYHDGMNLYEYVESAPPNGLDPSGTEDLTGKRLVDADALVWEMYKNLYESKQEWIQKNKFGWEDAAARKIKEQLCNSKCVQEADARTKCNKEADAIAKEYVEVFAERAYAWDSYGADQWRQEYLMYFSLKQKALEADAKIKRETKKNSFRNILAFRRAVGVNADDAMKRTYSKTALTPWNWEEYHAGWVCYQWATFVYDAVGKVIDDDRSDKKKSVIRQVFSGQGKVTVGKMGVTEGKVDHNWVTLKTKCPRYAKREQACQVRLDPWFVSAPVVFLPTEHGAFRWNWVRNEAPRQLLDGEMPHVVNIGSGKYAIHNPSGDIRYGKNLEKTHPFIGRGEKTWALPFTK